MRDFRLSRRHVLSGSATAIGVSMLPAGASALATPAGSVAKPMAGPLIQTLPTRIAGNDAFPAPYRKALPIDAPSARYPGFKPGTKLLKKGSIRREGAKVLPCDIVFERDVKVKLRDGTTIYTDVFRPAKPGKYPAIVAWSPYGKEIGGQWFDDVPGRAGVPLANVSELQKFEGPDPAFWCNEGYVVLNPDARGAYMSEGNMTSPGRQFNEDGYDFIQWAAKQRWCSGKVGMAGNSWLAISQWSIAGGARPPALAAIAPWEGDSSNYGEGGIVETTFLEILFQTFSGNNMVLDMPRMLATQTVKTPFWEDQVAQFDNIEIPAYIVASYTHPAHTHGTFEGFRRIRSKDKWLRVHNTQEWVDFNTDEHQRDLLKFFDRYLKDVRNDWEQTPRVRLAVLDPGHQDILNRPEQDFPLARQKFVPMYLGADGKLAASKPAAAVARRYQAQGGELTFSHLFTEDTELTGYMKMRLWVEAAGSDDMDVRVRVEKRRADGSRYPKPPGGPPGPGIAANGQLRVSLRELDPALSTPSEPVLLRRRVQKLKPGEIVPVDIRIWPMAMRYHAGEMLMVTVFGSQPHPMFHWGFGEAIIPVPADGGTYFPGETPKLLQLGGMRDRAPAWVAQQGVPELPQPNQGEHVVHFGGDYDSHLLIPIV